MTTNKSPAFQFYPKDWLSDARVLAMSWEERGMYFHMLCLSWLNGPLPSQCDRIAKLLAVPPQELEKAWPAIAPCWQKQGSTIVQPRLEEVRAAQKDYANKRSAAGKKGASARWKTDSDGNRIVLPLAKNGSASASASASASSSPTASSPPEEDTTPLSPPKGGDARARGKTKLEDLDQSLPEGLEREVGEDWHGWVESRWSQRKRWPLTQRAVNSARKLLCRAFYEDPDSAAGMIAKAHQSGSRGLWKPDKGQGRPGVLYTAREQEYDRGSEILKRFAQGGAEDGNA